MKPERSLQITHKQSNNKRDEILPFGAQLIHTDGRTDKTKQFCENACKRWNRVFQPSWIGKLQNTLSGSTPGPPAGVSGYDRLWHDSRQYIWNRTGSIAPEDIFHDISSRKVSHGVNTRTYFRTDRRRHSTHFEGTESQWRIARWHNVGKRTPLM
jgi:hypothetical protein